MAFRSHSRFSFFTGVLADSKDRPDFVTALTGISQESFRVGARGKKLVAAITVVQNGL